MERLAVSAVSKRYQPFPRRLVDLVRFGIRGGWGDRPATWALRDVSFAIGSGESLGIIGMNGAGKSTLLRILTATTTPSTGSVTTRGTVSALLELGLGMYPEFSGWQNATLACELMGMERAAIRTLLPAIQAFAELGAAMDQPVRTYSSGMQLRLAFSAATAMRPDVLIVDEVLAVGDAYFQHKCVDRIRAFQDAGTSLLLVSHDLTAVKALCPRALLLDQGRVLRDGPSAAVCDYYTALIAAKTQMFAIEQHHGDDADRTTTRSGSKDAEIVSVELTDGSGIPRRSFNVGGRARLRYRIRTRHRMTAPTVGFLIRDRLGVDVFGTNTAHLNLHHPTIGAGEELIVTFEVSLNLGPGSYSLAAATHYGQTHLAGSLDWWDGALVFTVVGSGATFVGTAWLPTRAAIARVGDDPLLAAAGES